MRRISDLNQPFVRRTSNNDLRPLVAKQPASTDRPAAALDAFEPGTAAPANEVRALAGTGGGSQAEQIVHELYAELLLRAPDEAGRKDWVAQAEQLLRDGSPADVKQTLGSAIRQSDEFQVIDRVSQSFKNVLGRVPQEKGYWHQVALDMRAQGASLDEIGAKLEAAHRQSDEHRLGNLDGMVSGLYQKHLMRAPDEAGMATWVADAEQMKAASMSPSDIEAVLSGKIRASDEYGTLQVVNRAFEEELGRTPEAKGDWHDLALKLRGEGKSLQDIDSTIRGHLRESAEYKQKHPAPAGMPWLGKVPEINQMNPAGMDGNYFNNNSNCGPASLAMVARAVGYGGGLTDSQLIMDMYRRAGTTIGDGTNVAGIVQGAQSIGLSATATYHSQNVDQLAADVRAGNVVIANGDFYALGVPGRVDNDDVGHYVVVEGMDDGGNFVINEPWDGRQYTVSPDQMRRFLAEWPGEQPNGHWVSISA